MTAWGGLWIGLGLVFGAWILGHFVYVGLTNVGRHISRTGQ